jgi:hypothetical protein
LRDHTHLDAVCLVNRGRLCASNPLFSTEVVEASTMVSSFGANADAGSAAANVTAASRARLGERNRVI